MHKKLKTGLFLGIALAAIVTLTLVFSHIRADRVLGEPTEPQLG